MHVKGVIVTTVMGVWLLHWPGLLWVYEPADE